jgi:hypothetical protein
MKKKNQENRKQKNLTLLILRYILLRIVREREI